MTSRGLWRDYGTPDLPRVLSSALHAFAAKGYHATSLRDIATGAGMSIPGVYHHFDSKQDVLVAVMDRGIEELLSRSRAALADADPNGPADGPFDLLVESMLLFHMFRSHHAFVATSEIRSLEGEHRARYVAKRDEQQALVADAIQAGRDAGLFATDFVGDAARAVSTMCVGVASWYRAEGPLDPPEIADRYLQFARGIVGAH